MNAPKTLLQQFKDLEQVFLNTYSYRNTGTDDASDIVTRFFVNAYTLSALAAEKDDRPKINGAMRHYEMQFGKMLGGEEALHEARKCGRDMARLMTHVRGRRSRANTIIAAIAGGAEGRYGLN